MDMLFLPLVAGFTAPVEIPTNAWSFVYLIPLLVLIALAYKTLKIEKITFRVLAKETAVLTASLLVFIVGVAIALYLICWAILR